VFMDGSFAIHCHHSYMRIMVRLSGQSAPLVVVGTVGFDKISESSVTCLEWHALSR